MEQKNVRLRQKNTYKNKRARTVTSMDGRWKEMAKFLREISIEFLKQ